MYAGAGTAVALAAAQVEAIKATGIIIEVEPDTFLSLLARITEPLVIRADSGMFVRRKRYLTSYKGLAFYTQSGEKLPLPMNCEIVEARKIWIPEMW
jgi:hypothetical protein